MRKLTGYIGALIVVFALMGSILAGYALNVNGESTVINEYEKVTDVSGLYTHSQEPSYIEYNPASNYIGYNLKQTDSPFTITNNTTLDSRLSYGMFTSWAPNCAWNTSQYAPGAFYYNGAVVPFSTSANNLGAYIYPILTGDGVKVFNKNPTADSGIVEIGIYNSGSWSRNWSNNLTFSYTDSVLTISDLQYGNTWTVSTAWIAIPYADGTFTGIIGPNVGYYQLPDYGAWYDVKNGAPTLAPVYQIDGYDVVNNYTIQPITDSWAFVKKTYDYNIITDKGIDYTRSNRVNNYLMETTNTTISYYSGSINMATLGAPDQFYYNSQGVKQIGLGHTIYTTTYDITGQYISPIPYPQQSITMPALLPNSGGIYDSNNPIYNNDGFHNVKLSNVLASFNAPAGTTSIKITTDSVYSQLFDYPVTVNIDKNLVWFSYIPNMMRDYGGPPSLNSEINKKDYLIFDVANNIATVYTYDGTARYSGSPDDIGIFFYTNDTTYKGMKNWRVDTSHNRLTSFYDMNDRPVPTINLTATIATPGILKYADITKGYAIKSTNTVNTVWNNNYQNGVINLLFRANDVNQTYHNELTISGNNITVDFENNHFYVTLGTNERVDIGTWRNIILNADLTNGYLSAVPVRTFNSFTNVIMDNTSIGIGELTSTGSTNIIEWAPTSNSLMFNVYSTSVFMDTYGVVMVNPTIDITNYFTDLNNFYRMRLFNFSVLGDSITVNGITADVVNNTITIDGQTVQLKEMAITYADGHAYISDSNASIDLGDISDNTISMAGAWYFETELQRGYTSQKMIYNWDWGDFILNNTQFCIMFMGLAVVALIVARRYCTMAITDYIVLVLSFIIALTVQVVA